MRFCYDTIFVACVGAQILQIWRLTRCGSNVAVGGARELFHYRFLCTYCIILFHWSIIPPSSKSRCSCACGIQPLLNDWTVDMESCAGVMSPYGLINRFTHQTARSVFCELYEVPGRKERLMHKAREFGTEHRIIAV